MDERERWSWLSILIGSIAMLLGAVDPLEGSLLILPGSGLVAFGAWLGRSKRRLVVYRVWTFVLIAVGVGALWGISSVGGIGGPHGRSMWWGVLILPYLIGWLLPFWGPGAPRWFLSLGIVVGLWYLAIPVIALSRRSPAGNGSDMGSGPFIVLGIIGVLAIAGCARDSSLARTAANRGGASARRFRVGRWSDEASRSAGYGRGRPAMPYLTA